MNCRAMTKAKKTFAIAARRYSAALVLPLALLAASCGGPPQADEPPLAGALIGGPFTLTDSAGNTVNWSDFQGKYRIVYFGYAYCPDVCPMDVQRIMAGYARFKEAHPERAAQIQPIFITIDPERDSREVVGEFTSAFSSDLIGLTGTPEQIAAAAKAFGVYYRKGEESQGGGYLMDHTNITYFMGRDGEPIAMLSPDQGPETVAAELDRWAV